MKFFRCILTIIAVLSVAGCFGFSVAAAMPDGEWDGKSDFRNNRNYILNKRIETSRNTVIPSDTVLTLNEGSQLIIPQDASIIINGGLNVKKGSTLIVCGDMVIGGEGSLSVSGKAYAEDNSTLGVSGGLNIKPEGLMQINSEAIFNKESITVSEGELVFKRDSHITELGRLYIENGGELITNGRVIIGEGGIMDSVGHLAVERKGVINVFGEMNLREASTLTESGKIISEENSIVTDLSTHADMSVYSAEILKNEETVTLRGIDVSWVQGDIDWETLSKSGIDFVYIRAGRGDIDGEGPKEDTYFFRNIQGANRYNIDAGVYFYSYAESVEAAEDEALLLIELLKGHTVTYPIVMDMEENIDKNDLTDIAEAFLDTVADAGYYPMLYSYRARIDSHYSNDFKEKYPIWVAQLEKQPRTDYDYYIWQYSHSGRVNGIEGNVDFNVAYRDFPDILRDYGLNKLIIDDEQH